MLRAMCHAGRADFTGEAGGPFPLLNVLSFYAYVKSHPMQEKKKAKTTSM